MSEIWNPGYDKFFYFLKKAPFTQWAASKFTVDGVEYTHAEQFMMAEKARLFNDTETLEKIMKAKTPREQKDLGRQVKGFDKAKWDAVARDSVYKGNYAKFTQNPEMKEALMATDGMLLVEVNPRDQIWGIGIDGDAARRGEPWRGLNWLGEVLTKLREALKNEIVYL
jgi:ribA/ribD-fused uncharacterized protein